MLNDPCCLGTLGDQGLELGTGEHVEGVIETIAHDTASFIYHNTTIFDAFQSMYTMLITPVYFGVLPLNFL